MEPLEIPHVHPMKTEPGELSHKLKHAIAVERENPRQTNTEQDVAHNLAGSERVETSPALAVQATESVGKHRVQSAGGRLALNQSENVAPFSKFVLESCSHVAELGEEDADLQ